MIFGESSELYQELYNQGEILSMPTLEYEFTDDYAHILITGSSRNPDKLYEMFKNRVKKMRDEGINKQDFERIKKMIYGEYIKEYNDVGDIAYEMTYTFKNDAIKELKGYQYAKPSDANVAEALWQITNKDQDQYNHYEGLTYDATFSEDKEIIMHYSIDAEKAPTMFATVSSLSGVKGIEKSMTKDAVKSIYEENGFTCK